jgi:hypothetical protein
MPPPEKLNNPDENGAPGQIGTGAMQIRGFIPLMKMVLLWALKFLTAIILALYFRKKRPEE